MDDTTLRRRLIRLAHEKPEIRKELLPLLRQADGPGDEMEAGRTWNGTPGKKYDKPPAIDKKKCYKKEVPHGGGKQNPGGGTCYRLHNEYGSGVSADKAEYNKKYREQWMDEDHQDRNTCPDGAGGKFDCSKARGK